jgi:hypothetical protein
MSSSRSAGPLPRLVDYAIAGTIGQLIVRAAVAARPYLAPAARRATVAGLAGGMLAGRRLAVAAEEARLVVGDLVAEAHAKVGEAAPAPAPRSPGPEHDHEH